MEMEGIVAMHGGRGVHCARVDASGNLVDAGADTFINFDTHECSATNARLIAYLDAVVETKYVLLAVGDEASSQMMTQTKTKIKEFGSAYIDAATTGWNKPWAMIGRKGAATGSVPEAYVGCGYVNVSQTFQIL